VVLSGGGTAVEPLSQLFDGVSMIRRSRRSLPMVRGVLRSKHRPHVFAGTTADAISAIQEAYRSQDPTKVELLHGLDGVRCFRNGTKVRRTACGFFEVKFKVVSGPHVGAIGWALRCDMA
jgi:hypothetical protein